jgi:hypothetical protein
MSVSDGKSNTILIHGNPNVHILQPHHPGATCVGFRVIVHGMETRRLLRVHPLPRDVHGAVHEGLGGVPLLAHHLVGGEEHDVL